MSVHAIAMAQRLPFWFVIVLYLSWDKTAPYSFISISWSGMLPPVVVRNGQLSKLCYYGETVVTKGSLQELWYSGRELHLALFPECNGSLRSVRLVFHGTRAGLVELTIRT